MANLPVANYSDFKTLLSVMPNVTKGTVFWFDLGSNGWGIAWLSVGIDILVGLNGGGQVFPSSFLTDFPHAFQMTQTPGSIISWFGPQGSPVWNV